MAAFLNLPLSRGRSRSELWKPVENRRGSALREFERCVKDTPPGGNSLIRLVLQLYSWEMLFAKTLKCSSWNIQHNVPVGTLSESEPR
jgi:hypothetical protein